MIDIELYETEEGYCPVSDYLQALEPKLLAKTLRTIDLLENNGPALRGPFSMPIGEGLFELRTKHGSNITRIIYFFFIGNKAILLTAFTKKTDKTPKLQLVSARKYKRDYERRYSK